MSFPLERSPNRAHRPATMPVPARRAIVALTLASLVACGGGEAPADASGATLSPGVDVALAAPGAGPVAGSRASCELAGFRAEALARLAAQRAAGADCGSHGAFVATSALAWNDSLTQAALAHSDDMMAANYFSHTGSDGSNAGARATAAGYAWTTWGENIAAGPGSVADAVAMWVASPGHCANLMNPAFRDVGLACVSGGAGNGYRSYWTMVLGRPR